MGGEGRESQGYSQPPGLDEMGLFPNRATWEASKRRCVQGCGGVRRGWRRHFRESRESMGGVWSRNGAAKGRAPRVLGGGGTGGAHGS